MADRITRDELATMTATGSGLNLRDLAEGVKERLATLEMEFPLRVVSEANQREHYMAKHRRKKEQQATVWAEWQLRRWRVGLPCLVRLTRVGPKALDSDNLAGAFKHVRDAIAAMIGVDDGSPLIRFEYAQEAIGRRDYAIRIEIQQGVE